MIRILEMTMSGEEYKLMLKHGVMKSEEKEDIYLFKLVSENLTKLGSPMGKEYTYDNYTKYFKDPEKAKLYAENEYGKKIVWKNTDKGWRSPDLSHVMYHIYFIETVD